MRQEDESYIFLKELVVKQTWSSFTINLSFPKQLNVVSSIVPALVLLTVP